MLLLPQITESKTAKNSVQYRLLSIGEGLYRISLIGFLLTIFLQLRFAPFDRFAIYDYLIPFVYISDLFLITLLVSFTLVYPRWIVSLYHKQKKLIVLITLMFISFAISNMFALHLVGAWYRFIQYMLYVLFALWMLYNRGKYEVSYYITLILVGLIPLVVLGIIQVITGHSLNLGIIGEWRYDTSMLGVATVNIFGREWLRPYATFPHPNVFAASVGLMLICVLFAHTVNRWELYAKRIIIGFLSVAVLVSMSRQVWLALLIVVIVYYLKRRSLLSKTSVSFLIGISIVLSLLFLSYGMTFFTIDQVSMLRRLELNNAAWRMFLSHPIWGVGLNQCILYVQEFWESTLPQFRQPVHNIYLLLLAESGVIGTLLFGSVLLEVIRHVWKISLLALMIITFIAVTGLFDHYWLTTHHGFALFSLTIGWGLVTIES